MRKTWKTLAGLALLPALGACGDDGGSMASASASASATDSIGESEGNSQGDGDGDGDTQGDGDGDGDTQGDGDGDTQGDGDGDIKFDLAPIGDASECPPEDPDCDICDPEFEPEEFVNPDIKCHWGDAAVVMTPLVADLENDGDVEIIFTEFTTGSLVIINGEDCSEVFTGPPNTFGTRSQLAVADIDDDGDFEIFGIQANNVNYGNHRILAVDHLGNTIAVSDAAQVTGGTFGDGGVSIVNLDGQGVPELVYAGMAVRLEGNNFTTLFNHQIQSGHWGILTAVADVDLDGVPEVVTGNRIFDGETGADETPNSIAGVQAGYMAIGDLDPDTPEPEIVLITSQSNQPSEIRVYHPISGDLVLGPINFGMQWGGPPTIGDFDGDEQPEIAVAGYNAYHVFDLECDVDQLPDYCEAPGIRWRQPSQDISSGSTGSTLFDFNGDGLVEVIYRDEQKLRIYAGPTGDILAQYDITSGTILENPVVADVDLDGHAEIVVPSHGGTQGIFVLEDPNDLWVAARALWNQHTYHITNILEDGTIPDVETNNWIDWNNYRQNSGPNPEDNPPCKPAPQG